MIAGRVAGRTAARSLFIAAAILLVAIPGPARAATAGPMPSATAAPPLWEHTWELVQRFVAAYDRHDLNAVMRLVDAPTLGYADCDFVDYKIVTLESPQSLRGWLRARFAEHDQYYGVTTYDAAHAVNTATGVSIWGERTSDILQARGLAPFSMLAKILPSRSGARLHALVFNSFNNCEGSKPPPGPTATWTQTIMRAFVDAYNAQDLPRVLQLLGTHVTYRDCVYPHQQVRALTTGHAISAWLRRRFRQHDILSEAPGPAPATIANGARRADVVLARSSSALAGSGVTSLPVPARFLMSRRGNRIEAVNLTGSSGCRARSVRA